MIDGIRVLLAEDATLIRLDLRMLLEDRGFEVCGEARDGLEAVELARSLEPDVVVLDVRMPNLDGIEAARRIYAERPVPIVMLTAYTERPLVERALAAGAFTYLAKPFTAADVVPAVQAAVMRHAELLAARRAVGDSVPMPIEIGVQSSGGHVWPLRVHRRRDGSIDVTSLEDD
jgi:DNA-binding NarL/FixJ family response regulator